MAAIVVCAAVGCLANAGPAQSQTIEAEKTICLKHHETEPPDRVILACTAIIAFRTLAESDRPLAFLRRAEAHQQKRQYELALADYSSAIAITPGLADAHFGRGVVGIWIPNQREQALADYDEAIRLDPRHDGALNNRSLFQTSDDKALADVSKAIRIAPQAAYFNNRASILTRRADHKGALADYSQAIKLEPTDAAYRGKRGDTLIELGMVKKAIADYTIAIALAPKVPVHHSSRAAAYEKIGERSKAIADVRESLRLFPNDRKARELLCRLGPPAERTADEQRGCPAVAPRNP
jgi:tetratricopeptide (TPR) repeat protein